MLKILKRNKLLIILITLTIIFFILGIFFNSIIDNDIKKNISLNIKDIFLNLKNSSNNWHSFFTCLFTNVIFITLIWFLGISIFGGFISLGLYLYKVFICGFEVVSLLVNFKLNRIIQVFFYTLPNIVNLFIYFIVCFFSINYSLILFKYIFFKEDINIRFIMKKYFKILILSFIFIFLNAIIDVFIISRVLLLFF